MQISTHTTFKLVLQALSKYHNINIWFVYNCNRISRTHLSQFKEGDYRELYLYISVIN